METQHLGTPHRFAAVAVLFQLTIAGLIATAGLFAVVSLERRASERPVASDPRSQSGEVVTPFLLTVTQERDSSRFIFLVATEWDRIRLESALQGEAMVRQSAAEIARDAVVVMAADDAVADAVRADASLVVASSPTTLEVVDLRDGLSTTPARQR